MTLRAKFDADRRALEISALEQHVVQHGGMQECEATARETKTPSEKTGEPEQDIRGIRRVHAGDSQAYYGQWCCCEHVSL